MTRREMWIQNKTSGVSPDKYTNMHIAKLDGGIKNYRIGDFSPGKKISVVTSAVAAAFKTFYPCKPSPIVYFIQSKSN